MNLAQVIMTVTLNTLLLFQHKQTHTTNINNQSNMLAIASVLVVQYEIKFSTRPRIRRGRKKERKK